MTMVRRQRSREDVNAPIDRVVRDFLRTGLLDRLVEDDSHFVRLSRGDGDNRPAASCPRASP